MKLPNASDFSTGAAKTITEQKNTKNKLQIKTVLILLIILIPALLLFNSLTNPNSASNVVPAATVVSSTPAPGNTTNAASSIKITYPLNNSIISYNEDPLKVQGDYQAVLGDIWVIIYPGQSDRGWPQYKTVQENGKWFINCYFGNNKGSRTPMKIDIVAYEANASASNFLNSIVKKWADDNFYPGLTVKELPAGLTEKARVTITRK